MERGRESSSRQVVKRPGAARRPSLLVRVLVVLLIVVAVGAVSFLVGYLIGLQLGAVGGLPGIA